MESSDSKVTLRLGANLYFLKEGVFAKQQPIIKESATTVEVGSKGPRELFKVPLVTQEANATTSHNAAETVNAIKQVTGPELTPLPNLVRWTVAN